MNSATVKQEKHSVENSGWLRAGVLGANDGLISTASLVIGVAASGVETRTIWLSGVAGLVAGAMSMAAGEFVSVSSQRDTERADLNRERLELAANPDEEHEELAQIYVERGLEESLARQVAEQLMLHDALGSHARDELGITDLTTARPVQAAVVSAISFATGAIVPLLLVLVTAPDHLLFTIMPVSVVMLFMLGAIAARAGGAQLWKGATRVALWGVLAMTATAIVGRLFGTSSGL